MVLAAWLLLDNSHWHQRRQLDVVTMASRCWNELVAPPLVTCMSAAAPHESVASLHLALPSSQALEAEVRQSEPSRLAWSAGVVVVVAAVVAVVAGSGWGWCVSLFAGPLGLAGLVHLRNPRHRGRGGSWVAATGLVVGSLAVVVPLALVLWLGWAFSTSSGHY